MDHLHFPGRTFTVSIENNNIHATNDANITSAELVKGLDDCKGTPPEQIKQLFLAKAEEIIADVESTIGWPEAVKMVENFELRVTLSGHTPVEEFELDLDILVDEYSPYDTPPNGINSINL